RLLPSPPVLLVADYLAVSRLSARTIVPTRKLAISASSSDAVSSRISITFHPYPLGGATAGSPAPAASGDPAVDHEPHRDRRRDNGRRGYHPPITGCTGRRVRTSRVTERLGCRIAGPLPEIRVRIDAPYRNQR